MTEQNFDAAFERVRNLVSDFQRHEKTYLSPAYSEQDVRKDFIDKFWIAHGWDVNHEQQKNPYEQEVKVERNVNVKGRKKKADYAFLAPNFRDVRFFVEAKKPARNIENPDDYFQTIRYGWNSSTTLSILTDFEQFHVLDCRYKPDVQYALNRALKKFHYAEYADAEKFREIYFLFSRAAVLDGSLEKYAATLPKPTGKAKQRGLFGGSYKSVDEDFLAELDELRDELARSFKNRNQHLNGEELTEATQRTLDRLVFMRFLEDKLIEPEVIVERLGEHGSAWADFVSQSERLNNIYNGIIFRRHTIIDKPDFAVDERVFEDVRERLAHTNSPYNFDALPVHILGSIYERFLGKVIVTTDKRAKVVEKPEVRKAGGVYYTPAYIVRYIVENTIGKIIEGKTPEEIAALRFADIACGSGSFLLGVFDELLRYHTAYYNRNKTKRAEGLRAGCIENEDGSLRLALKQKKKILLNNLYGVDLDAQAVEVAQLSLFLKLLEDETTASAKGHQLEFRETMLPSLDKNVIHGNSLIGWDIGGGLFGDEEERKLHPMDFELAFPEVMRRGGFDVIIGNPPYLYSAGQGNTDYFKRKFKLSEYQTDFYVYFIEQALNVTRSGGKVSFIVSDSWLNSDYFSKLRTFLLTKHQIELLATFDYPVFKKVTLENSIFVVTHSEKPKAFPMLRFSGPEARSVINEVEPEYALRKGLISPFMSQTLDAVIEKIERGSIHLDSVVKLNRGIHAYRTDGYGKTKFGTGVQTRKDKELQAYHADRQIDETYLPEIKGKDVDRFTFTHAGKYLSYGDWLAEARESEFFFKPKIVLRKILGTKLHGTYIEEKCAIDQSLYIAISPDDDVSELEYLLGVLLSKVGAWYLRTKYAIYDTLYPWYTKKQLASFPIKSKSDRLVGLVEQMLAAKRQLQTARTDSDRNFYENKCAALDRQIDSLVYELYDLTPEEIAIVEGRD